MSDEKRGSAASAGSKPASSNDLDDALQDSFPASDPPATHLPDEPPSNAEAQWEEAGINRKGAQGRSAGGAGR